MPRTRADNLRDAVAFALRKVKIQGRKGVLTEEQRYEIGDHVVYELRRYGDPWKLDRVLTDPAPGVLAYKAENRPPED